jgi:hypothetical protein
MSSAEIASADIDEIVAQIGEDTAPIIQELTQESMLRLKDSIKTAILTLRPYKVETNASSPIYLLETDVLAKIEQVYQNILHDLQLAREAIFPTILSEGVEETIEELHEIVDKPFAFSQRLPASPTNNNGNNAFSPNPIRDLVNQTIEGNEHFGGSRSRKLKKSRKHPK